MPTVGECEVGPPAVADLGFFFPLAQLNSRFSVVCITTWTLSLIPRAVFIMISIHHLHILGWETDLPAYIFRDTLALIGEINISGCDPPPRSTVAYITPDEDWPLAAASQSSPLARLLDETLQPQVQLERGEEFPALAPLLRMLTMSEHRWQKCADFAPRLQSVFISQKYFVKGSWQRSCVPRLHGGADRNNRLLIDQDGGGGWKTFSGSTAVQIILTFGPESEAISDICILQSPCPAFVMMSNLLNSHESGLCRVLSGYKLPCTTYVLFSPNLLSVAPGAKQEEPVDTESL